VVAEPSGGVTQWRGRRRIADRWFNAGGGAPMIELRGRGAGPAAGDGMAGVPPQPWVDGGRVGGEAR
jgi:hypothetical protein